MKKLVLTFIVLISVSFATIDAQKGDKATTTVSAEQAVSIVLKNKTLTVTNIKSGDKIEILNILGVKVLEKRTDKTTAEFQLELQHGYYIVKVGSVVRKISLK